MADIAHTKTDQKLEEMEKRLSAIYSRAEKEIQKTADEYFSKFAAQDEKKRKLLEQGKITEEEYTKWRKGKVMYGKRFAEMKEQCAKQLLNVNQTALAYVNGELPEVYAINYNALESAVDGVEGYSFTLVDADTVRNLAVTDASLLPYKEIDPAKDIPWNMKKINAETLQGILQGESMDKIAKRIMNVQEMNKTQAIRSARTIVTGAECKGRQDSYQRAKDDGIILRKYWLATYDKRARDWHKEAGNDYTEEKAIDIDDFFIVDGEKMLHPGDAMHGASGHNLYNCRCSIASKVIGFKKAQVQKAMAEKRVEPEYKKMPQGYRRKFMRQQEQDYYRYAPAKTVKQANAYLDSIVKNGSVSIGDGVTVEQANAISMALTDIHSRYGVKLDLRNIKHAKENYQGAYNPTSHTFLVKGNKSSWAKNAEKNYASGFNASGDTYQVFYHELGHAMWEELPYSTKKQIEDVYSRYRHDAYEQWREMGGASSGKTQADVFGKYLSRYGHTNKDEFFAECFAQIMTDYDGDAAFDVGIILDEVFKK